MNKKKGIPHVICERMPAFAMVLSVLIITILVSIADAPLVSLCGSNEALHHLFSCVVAVIIMLLVKLWLGPNYKGALKANIPMSEIMKMLIPFFIYFFVNVIFLVVTKTFFFEPTFTKFCMGLDAGFSEETMFRVAAIPIGLIFMKSSKKVFQTLIVTSVVFGVFHLINITGGGEPSVIVMQAIATTFMGVYFAALFMLSGSILVPVIIHSIWDFFCFTCDSTLSNGIMTDSSITFPLVMAVLVNVVIGVVGIMMVRKYADKIERIWSEKWVS